MMGQFYGEQHSTPAQARDLDGPRDPRQLNADQRAAIFREKA
jgi:hypothetical protein